ncbi:MAG: FkbM family methyltransferase [Oscillospiraceae bacterium]
MERFEKHIFERLEESWDFLKNTALPIFIYGMGDGCLKLLREFRARGIAEAGIFASDEFVRGHSFAGHKVHTLAEVEEQVDEFVVVIAFAAGYPALMEKIERIAARHKLLFPDTAVIGGGAFTKQMLLDNWDQASRVYELLADAQSRAVFEQVIRFKITGDISFLKSVFTMPAEAYERILHPAEEEAYCDLGAYNGDTVREFLEFTGGAYASVTAFEPNGRNFRKLTEAFSEKAGIALYNCAAWDSDTTLEFAKGSGRQAKLADVGADGIMTNLKTVPVQALRLDTTLAGARATYIKYDVEGAEREALAGSAQTIARHKPKLCCAVYHRPEDLFELPLLVHGMNPAYKLYLRQYPYYPAWETNLFAAE